MSKNKALSLDQFIARNIYKKKNVRTAICYFAPDDGSVSLVTEKTDLIKNVMYGQPTFEYPVYLRETDYPKVEEFYDNYLSLGNDPKSKTYKLRFMNQAVDYDGYYAHSFETLPRYSESTDLMLDALKEAVSLKLTTEESFLEELKKLISKTDSVSGFELLMATPLEKGIALYKSIVNKKMKLPKLSLVEA